MEQKPGNTANGYVIPTLTEGDDFLVSQGISIQSHLTLSIPSKVTFRETDNWCQAYVNGVMVDEYHNIEGDGFAMLGRIVNALGAEFQYEWYDDLEEDE